MQTPSVKLLLVYPDFTESDTPRKHSGGNYSEGLASISAVLKKAGVGVSLLHLLYEHDKEQFLEKLKGYDFDLIGFSVRTTAFEYVKKLAGFLRKGTIFLTGLAVTVFTGIAAIQGMVTKAADGILINTTKFSLDNFVPIVGGFAADSLDMVISCVGLIKNAIGVAGILLILALLVIPVLKILAVAVIYKITAIAAEPVASKNISDSLNELGTAAITMTVVLAIGALMFLIFIAIIMGMGGGGRWN